MGRMNHILARSNSHFSTCLPQNAKYNLQKNGRGWLDQDVGYMFPLFRRSCSESQTVLDEGTKIARLWDRRIAFSHASCIFEWDKTGDRAFPWQSSKNDDCDNEVLSDIYRQLLRLGVKSFSGWTRCSLCKRKSTDSHVTKIRIQLSVTRLFILPPSVIWPSVNWHSDVLWSQLSEVSWRRAPWRIQLT